MSQGTSRAQNIAASASWQSFAHSPASMAPPPTGMPSLTTINDVQVLPFPSAFTATASGTPVVINLHADITIERYDHFYHTPLSSFRPIYYAVDDGSLLTDAYTERIAVTKVPVFIAGALVVFFLRNARKSLVFLRRTRVKDKTLFYLLAWSQFLGLAGSVVEAVGLLDINIGCIPINTARKVLLKLSGDTMVTGIIGMKAYRCLGNNRLVLLFLFVMTTIMWSLEGLHLANYTAIRSPYGVCQTTSNFRYVSLIMWADFVETTILCACFSYVVWKSCNMRKNACGTLSSTGDELYDHNEAKDGADAPQYSRGWWDYNRDAGTTSSNQSRPSSRSLKHAFKDWILRLWPSDQFAPSIAYQRKPSLPGEFPLPQPPRRTPSSSAPFVRRIAHVSYSSVMSTLRKWGRHTSGRQLFQKMLRNELLFTTVMAAMFMAMAIMLLVGIHHDVALSPEQWIILNWVTISLCTMHSFSRVVRRNELESVLQHPAAWDRMLRTDTNFSRIFYGSISHRTSSGSSRASSKSPPPRPPHIRVKRSGDGFANFRFNNPSQDGLFSLYTISPLTPSGSRKPSYTSTIPSQPHRQRVLSPYDSRSPTPDTLAPLPYSPPPSFSRFSFITDPYAGSQDRPPAPVPPRLPMDPRRHSLDAWTDQRTSLNHTDPNKILRKNSS